MKTRFTFGGGRVRLCRDRRGNVARRLFKALSMSNAVRDAKIASVTEICPTDASFQVRFDPGCHRPRRHHAAAQRSWSTRPIPPAAQDADHPRSGVHRDPWTQETLMRCLSGIRIPAAPIWTMRRASNGFRLGRRIHQAHHAQPVRVDGRRAWPGCRSYQLVERDKQLQVPKYLRPRTDTPKLTVGHGGCFACIYSVRGAGDYQMFGVTPGADL